MREFKDLPKTDNGYVFLNVGLCANNFNQAEKMIDGLMDLFMGTIITVSETDKKYTAIVKLPCDEIFALQQAKGVESIIPIRSYAVERGFIRCSQPRGASLV